MRIGEIATQTKVSVQALRYYERRGLLPSPSRQSSGYRLYDHDALQRVRFIRRAQDLGFTLQEIGDLLRLWADSTKSCSAVEKRARKTLEGIDGKISDLERMRTALSKYVGACHNGSSLDECPLLAALGDDNNAEA
ncbi:MAG: heavy metal-responsive transcriptional regulator [Gemmatimonadota bacterium]|nr:heavy metal-responsive transcriptional regulator [Gemmatimonadota bacterium]